MGGREREREREREMGFTNLISKNKIYPINCKSLGNKIKSHDLEENWRTQTSFRKDNHPSIQIRCDENDTDSRATVSCANVKGK